MAKYIDRDKLIKAVEDLQDCYNGFSDTYDKACIIGLIEEMPTADVVEVKHGKWIYKDGGGWHCSECGVQAPFWCMASTQNLSEYCPNCGSDMRKETEDEN